MAQLNEPRPPRLMTYIMVWPWLLLGIGVGVTSMIGCDSLADKLFRLHRRVERFL